MPQDVKELGRRVKAKYPGKYDDLADEDIGRRVKRKYPGAYDDFTDTPAPPTQGIYESFQTGAAGPLLRNVVETATDVYNRPLETLERAGRAGLEFISAFDPAGKAYEPTVQSQVARMTELRRRAEAERPETIKLMERGMQQLEAEPRTRTGRIAYGTGRVLGEVAFPTAPESAVQNVVMAPFGGAAVGAGKQAFKASVGAVRRAFGKGAAQVIEAEAGATTAPVSAVREAVSTQPAASLESAFTKLGTNNVDEVGEMIANANRRLNKTITVPGGTKRPRTTAEQLSSWDDYKKLNQLTADEQRALGQVLPARTVSPIIPGYSGKGSPSRDISDIPLAEPNAQLDANLRELEQFFAQEGRAAGPAVAPQAAGIAERAAAMARTPTSPVSLPQLRAEFPGMGKQQFDDEVLKAAQAGDINLMRHDAPGLVSEAERNAMVKVGNDYFTAATVNGPRVSQAAAFEVAPTTAPAGGRVPPSPPGDIPTGFGGAAPRGQQQLFDAAAKSPWQDTLLAYIRGNLLTNPISRAQDLGNTIINQFADAAIRPLAAAVDIIVSKGTKARGITGPSLRGTGRAFGSIRQGFRDVREVLKTGRQAIDSGADDVLYGNEIRSGLGKVFDVPVNGVFRLLGALDAPFRRFGYVRNLYDRARVAAINEARRGRIPYDQITARTQVLIDRPDIIKAAVRDGERAVLSESNKFSSWVAAQTRNSPNLRLAVGILQPFLRIPANAAMRSADFAGVGGVKALYKLARGVGRKAKGKSFFRDIEDQRIFAQNMAAGSFAPAAFILGMELQDRGKLEGFYYTGGKDYPNGKVPTSIEIGGRRIDVNRLGGFLAAPLFVGATYNRLRKQDVGKANAFLRSFSGLAQQVPGLGYYGAPSKASRILTSDKPGAEVAKQVGDIGAGFIPASGLVRATARAFDLLPQKGPRSTIVDASLDRNRPLFAELQRLNKRVSELRKTEGEKDDAFNARAQQFGQNYTQYGLRLLQNERFKAAPDALKAIALDRLNDRAKRITNRENAFSEIELDPNLIMDAAELSKKNPASK